MDYENSFTIAECLHKMHDKNYKFDIENLQVDLYKFNLIEICYYISYHNDCIFKLNYNYSHDFIHLVTSYLEKSPHIFYEYRHTGIFGDIVTLIPIKIFNSHININNCNIEIAKNVETSEINKYISNQVIDVNNYPINYNNNINHYVKYCLNNTLTLLPGVDIVEYSKYIINSENINDSNNINNSDNIIGSRQIIHASQYLTTKYLWTWKSGSGHEILNFSINISNNNKMKFKTIININETSTIPTENIELIKSILKKIELLIYNLNESYKN